MLYLSVNVLQDNTNEIYEDVFTITISIYFNCSYQVHTKPANVPIINTI